MTREQPTLESILHDLSNGVLAAESRLYEHVYDELRTIARHHLRRGGRIDDVHSTVLVHEAYLRLRNTRCFENRRHFFGAVGTAMQNALVDTIRQRTAQKRKKGEKIASLGVDPIGGLSDISEVLDIATYLDELSEIDARKADVVRNRVFLGLSLTETADALELPLRTAERDWSMAKAWIKDRLRGT